MSDASTAVKSLRERLSGVGEDHLGKALSDLLDNPLLTGTIGRAFDAREKAVQAQELAMGALNIPSAADIERLTRRLRSVSQRLEGIEDGVYRLDRALAARGVDSSQIGERLSKIEQQLGALSNRLDKTAKSASAGSGPAQSASAGSGAAKSGSAGSASAKAASAGSMPAKAASAASGSAGSKASASRSPAQAKQAKAKAKTAKAKKG